MRILLTAIATLLYLSVTAQVAEGDSVRILKDKPLKGIEPDYFRNDSWRPIQQSYITMQMPGKTYEIYRVKRGYIWIKTWDIKMNDATPAKYKLNLKQLLQSGSVEIIKK